MLVQNDEHIPRCPHCAKPLVPLRYGVSFGPLAVRIIDTIEAAGHAGITTADLLRAVYHDRTGTRDRLRSYVGSINATLNARGAAVIIRSDGLRYRITTRRRA